MSDDERDLCGEPNKHGGACKNPATEPDGSCWLPSHGEGEDDGTGPRPGRPDKLTVERQQAICEDLEKGYSIKVAAVTNGIAEDTFHRWRSRGRAAQEADEEGRFREFYERTERARSEGERRWTDRAYKAAMEAESFGAMMEILRKRYPESWSPEHMDDGEKDRLRVLLSSDESPEDAGREYTMRPNKD